MTLKTCIFICYYPVCRNQIFVFEFIWSMSRYFDLSQWVVWPKGFCHPLRPLCTAVSKYFITFLLGFLTRHAWFFYSLPCEEISTNLLKNWNNNKGSTILKFFHTLSPLPTSILVFNSLFPKLRLLPTCIELEPVEPFGCLQT